MECKKRIAALLAAALLFLATGCGAAANDDSLQRVLDAGQLVMGLDAAFPPMSFPDASGEITGFDVDVAQEVCDRLGVALVRRPIDWNAKEDLLNRGEIDCIWCGMSYTPARAESMNLSDTYMLNELILLVPQSSEARLPRDLRGKRVGLQPSTSEQDALEASELYSEITAVYGKDYVQLMEQMQRGEIDAVFTDSLFAYYYIFKGGEPVYVLPDSLGEDGYVVGFRKADQALRDRVQELLNEMSADGTLGSISKKWFGIDATLLK